MYKYPNVTLYDLPLPNEILLLIKDILRHDIKHRAKKLALILKLSPVIFSLTPVLFWLTPSTHMWRYGDGMVVIADKGLVVYCEIHDRNCINRTWYNKKGLLVAQEKLVY